MEEYQTRRIDYKTGSSQQRELPELEYKLPALKLILQEVDNQKRGNSEAWSNRYPDYHNCCIAWGS